MEDGGTRSINPPYPVGFKGALWQLWCMEHRRFWDESLYARCGCGYQTVRHPLSARFHQILHEMADLHDKKQADYGRDDDPFANVRGSEDFGVPAWVGAMVRLNDKVRRLQKAARGGTLVNEGVIDSFNDLAVYAVIARILYEEGVGNDSVNASSCGNGCTHGDT